VRGQSLIGGYALRLAVLAAGLNCAASAMAQDDDGIDDESESCLSMNLVRSARAIDDETILFELRDGRMYLNSLDQDCPGLRRNNRFSYNLRTGARIPRLCHTDTITVIERSGDGFTCGLGRFEPISVVAAEDLQPAPDEPDPEVTVIDVETDEAPSQQAEPDGSEQSP
jgi:hypothetical protein